MYTSIQMCACHACLLAVSAPILHMLALMQSSPAVKLMSRSEIGIGRLSRRLIEITVRLLKQLLWCRDIVKCVMEVVP